MEVDEGVVMQLVSGCLTWRTVRGHVIHPQPGGGAYHDVGAEDYRYVCCVCTYVFVCVCVCVFVCVAVFSPGFFEGVVGGGAGIRARRWEK